MAISTITYAADKIKSTWAYLETVMPAAYNEINRVVMELVTSNNALQALLDLKAPLDSPALTGTPTSPTPATADDSTKIATTAFVKNNQPEAYIIEHYENGDNWYDKYSNGWIEQGGYNNDNSGAVTINFVAPFSTKCFGVVQCSGNTGRIEGNPFISSIGLTSFTFGDYGKGYWRAYGK